MRMKLERACQVLDTLQVPLDQLCSTPVKPSDRLSLDDLKTPKNTLTPKRAISGLLSNLK